MVISQKHAQNIENGSNVSQEESQENISYFWKLWNEVLQIVGDKDANYKFNPRNIMVDSSGANYCAVKLVFGIEYMSQKLISCQWHFVHNMEQLSSEFDEDIKRRISPTVSRTPQNNNNSGVSTGGRKIETDS